MYNKNSYLIALMLGTSTAISSAQAATDTSTESTSPIIVTATRTAQTADETLASVTVITREDIEASHSNSLMELLQSHTVGLDVSRNGGPGSTTSLYLRGTEADHVLVLIDGVRVGSVTTGSFNWAGISPDQIDRIEIVRGPDSSLYGSEAIGGVVQIFTRKGKGLHASLTGGSYHTGKASIGTGGKIGNSSFHINLDHEQAEGFSTTSPDSSRYEADHDSYRQSSASAGFSLPLGSTSTLGMNLLNSRGRNDYDDSPYPDAYADTANSSGELHLDWQTTGIWSQRFMLNASRDRYESHDSWPADITTRRRGANWQNDIALGDTNLLTLGIDLQRDRGEITGSYDQEITNRASYLQYQWSGERFDLLLGGRSDKHSEYGRHKTGRFTVGSRLGEGRVYASYATAFKAPSFNELYYPFYGNPNLEPEESATTELGYRVGAFQASLYRTRIKNMIQSDPATWTAANIGRALLKGLELEYRHNVGQWQLDSALTLQKTEDEESGDELLRRAEKKLLFTACGPVTANTTFGIEANYTGPRMDYGNVELASYTLLNLTGEYRLAKQWMLSARIENLLDEQYQLAYGYNTAGASAYLTMSYKQ